MPTRGILGRATNKPTNEDWNAGRVGVSFGLGRKSVEEFLESGFYEEPKRLSEWFSSPELQRLREISWQERPEEEKHELTAVFLRPFSSDGNLISAPVQLVLRLGRTELIRLYKSHDKLNRRRMLLAFTDREFSPKATEEEMFRGRIGAQIGYMQTLHLVSEIEQHLERLALGVVDFRIQDNLNLASSKPSFIDRWIPNAWRFRVVRDLHRSDVIFVVPSYHTGTLWEIELIAKDGLLDKVCFLVPMIVHEEVSRVADEWRETFRQLELRFGLKPDRSLPFEDSGMITDSQFLLRLEGTVLSASDNGYLHLAQPLHLFRFLIPKQGT